MGASNSKRKVSQSLEIKVHECVDVEGNINQEKLLALKVRWEHAQCDIAVLGASGSGKSTLINNLLGALPKSNEENEEAKIAIDKCDHKEPTTCNHIYAPVDSRECTTKATPYTFQEQNKEQAHKVLIWDLPGYGAQYYSSVEYYWNQLEIDKYGTFIFVFKDNRVKEHDVTAVKYLLEQGKFVIWVRTHFEGSMKGKQNEAALVEKQKSQDYLQKLGIFVNICGENGTHKSTVYHVSGLYCPEDPSTIKYLYDLEELKAAIIDSVPEEQQALLATRFQGFSASLINSKYVVMKKWITICVIVSVGTAFGTSFVPVGGSVASAAVDLALVYKFKTLAAQTFGFTEDGQLISSKFDEAKAALARQVAATLTGIIAEIIIATTATTVLATSLSAAASIVPVVGTAVSTTVSGSLTGTTCHRINVAYRDAALAMLAVIHDSPLV